MSTVGIAETESIKKRVRACDYLVVAQLPRDRDGRQNHRMQSHPRLRIVLNQKKVGSNSLVFNS